jgi:hypothetical protein
VYSCRFCNRARSSRPIQGENGRLLDPTKAAWSNHFELIEDNLSARPGDPDAAYTYDTYDIDEPRKVRMRRLRRELIADHVRALQEFPRMISLLLALAQDKKDDPEAVNDLVQHIHELRMWKKRVAKDLQTYPAVPWDAPKGCRCEARERCSLPSDLERQTIDLPPV